MKFYIIGVCFILFDVITGVMKALYQGDINSTALRQGLYHKLSEVLAIVGSGALTYACKYIELGVNIPVVGVVVSYICIMELVSVLENLCEMNPSLRQLFKPYLEKLKDGDSDERH